MQEKDKNRRQTPAPISLEAPKVERRDSVPRPMPTLAEDEFIFPSHKRSPQTAKDDSNFFHQAQKSYSRRPARRLRKKTTKPKTLPFFRWLGHSLKDTQRTAGSAKSKPRRRPRQLGQGAKVRSGKPILDLSGGLLKLGSILIGMGMIAFVIFMLVSLTQPNALAVYLDGRHIGYIALDSELEAATIQAQAVAHLTDNVVGAAVIVDQEISISPARARGGEQMSRSEMLSRLEQHFTYQISAVAIYVNGRYELTVSTVAHADEVASLLQRYRINANTVEYGFVEDWELRPNIIESDQLQYLFTPHVALDRLNRNTTVMYPYEVQSGDQLGVIAVRFGTTVTQIARDNNMTTEAIIQPGQILQVNTVRPLLSVRTVDEITTLEESEMEVETRYNPTLAMGTINIITYGTTAQSQVTRRITRIDGVEVSNEIIHEQVMRQPTVQIEEIGTSETAITRR